jgi:hypothetical protein
MSGWGGIYVGSLDVKPEEQDSKPLIAGAFDAEYVPTSGVDSGLLLLVRDEALVAQPFDARHLALTGEPATVVDHIGVFRDGGSFSASANGVLVYWTGTDANSQLRWFDRQGKTLGTPLEVGPEIYTLSFSPHGTVAAVGRNNGLWLADFSRGTSTRFTFGSDFSVAPVWSPDGSRIIFSAGSLNDLNLYEKPANGVGNEEILLKSDESKVPSSWSRDGRYLLYTAADPKTARSGLWVLPLEGDKKPFPVLRTEFNERSGQFSPDGRWVAYSSDESGRNEVYVQTFSPSPAGAVSSTATKVLISTAGGTDPRWRGDGKELYYVSLDGTLMAVDVTTSPRFQAGVPKPLFRVPPSASPTSFSWDLAPDGSRFLFPAPPEQSNTPLTVVLNWQAALKK